MQSKTVVLLDFLVKAHWTPLFGEERNRNSLAKRVELQTTATDGVHDRRVVNDLDFNAFALSTKNKIHMSCGTKL